MTFNSIMRVARYLGKGEVVSSILTGSTSFLKSNGTHHERVGYRHLKRPLQTVPPA